MPSVLAIVSTAIFEKEARQDGQLLREGQTFATWLYRSKSKGLAACEIKEQAHEHLLREAMEHPFLATIETLVAPAKFGVQDELRSLRHFYMTQSGVADLLRAKRSMPLETQGVYLEDDEGTC